MVRVKLCAFIIYTLSSISTCWNETNRLRKAKLVRQYKKFKPEGTVRLVGGSDSLQGNVEVYHDSIWGSVCDDEWDERDADVICRQLGLGTSLQATHSSFFGLINGSILMDNVMCKGDEAQISECRFDGWKNHDCTPQEAGGVVCSAGSLNATRVEPQPILKFNLQDILGDGLEIRLRGGRVGTEGRIEFKAAHADEWLGICGEGWSLLEAQVICRSLNIGFAQMATQSAFYSSGEAPRIGLFSVECRGNETTLDGCSGSAVDHASCPPQSHAGVICTPYMADLVIDYEEVMRSAYLEDRPLYLLQCAMEENCLARGAYKMPKNSNSWYQETRRLMRFTASVQNIGNTEFRPALPKNLWQFHQCHMHYHSMEVFATFDVYSGKEKVAEGHKASFCLEDNRCEGNAKPSFACANYGDQGISVNCSDVYKHNIDCQWIDLSEIDPGVYTLKIGINPEFKVAEMSFENNAAICKMYYGTSSVYISHCHLDRP